MQIICICEKSRYLKNIVDDSVIVCDKIINVIDSASTNVTNNIPANVTNTVSKNSDDTKVIYKMDYYILHPFLLVTYNYKLMPLTLIAIDMQKVKKKKQQQQQQQQQLLGL